MMRGFVKINRDISERDWYKEPLTLMLYIHLTITAKWRDDICKGIAIGKGERIASYAALAAETGLSIQNVRTALSHLIATGDITKRTEGKYTVISVKSDDDSQLSNSINSNVQLSNSSFNNTLNSDFNTCSNTKSMTSEEPKNPVKNDDTFRLFNTNYSNVSNSNSIPESTPDKEYKEYKELKEREEEEEKADSKNFNKESSSSVSDVVNLYCELCKSLPSPDVYPETEANIRRAINFHGIEKIKSAFSTVENTPFLRGDVKNWCADINWIFAGTNIDKILSGKYREYRERNSRSREVSDSYGIDNLEEYKEFINNF